MEDCQQQRERRLQEGDRRHANLVESRQHVLLHMTQDVPHSHKEGP